MSVRDCFGLIDQTTFSRLVKIPFYDPFMIGILCRGCTKVWQTHPGMSVKYSGSLEMIKMLLITKRLVFGKKGNRHQDGDFKEAVLVDGCLRWGGRGGGWA